LKTPAELKSPPLTLVTVRVSILVENEQETTEKPETAEQE